jgi:hypothetical protein
MGEIKRSGDPRPMDPNPQRIKVLTTTAQHQLPQQLSADGV